MFEGLLLPWQQIYLPSCTVFLRNSTITFWNFSTRSVEYENRNWRINIVTNDLHLHTCCVFKCPLVVPVLIDTVFLLTTPGAMPVKMYCTSSLVQLLTFYHIFYSFYYLIPNTYIPIFSMGKLWKEFSKFG